MGNNCSYCYRNIGNKIDENTLENLEKPNIKKWGNSMDLSMVGTFQTQNNEPSTSTDRMMFDTKSRNYPSMSVMDEFTIANKESKGKIEEMKEQDMEEDEEKGKKTGYHKKNSSLKDEIDKGMEVPLVKKMGKQKGKIIASSKTLKGKSKKNKDSGDEEENDDDKYNLNLEEAMEKTVKRTKPKMAETIRVTHSPKKGPSSNNTIETDRTEKSVNSSKHHSKEENQKERKRNMA